MRIHFSECTDLSQVDTLSVSKSDDFIECMNQIESISQNLFFVIRTTVFWDDTGEETQGFEILENIRVLCSDKNDVDIIQWMIDIPDTVGFDEGVLASG